MILRPHLKTLTLLCVESSNAISAIYEEVLKILFKRILFAKNAEDGLLIYEKNKIDIIITAQSFNGISGIDFIRQIRKNDEETPIIFASSFEQVNILTEALHLRVTRFVKKPFETTLLIDAIEDATKQLLAKKYIQERQQEEVNALKDRVHYSDYQESLSFQKALKVIRNDFYYKQLKQTDESITIIDFLYTPRDIISGDSYSARIINKDIIFLFLIDGMGKGLSASISALIATSFLNRRIDLHIKTKKSFSLKNLTQNAIKHTQKILLDDEILSISFVLMDSNKHTIEYASFSMPSILITNKDNELTKLKSNNPPLSAYTKDFKTEKLPFKNIKKLLIYSDGLVENSLQNEEDTYAKYIEEDFKNSITREDLRKKIISKIAKQEDDITFIFLNNIFLDKPIKSMMIDSKLDEIEKANEWFEKILLQKTKCQKTKSHAGIAFMELLMNAYEHGNLHISGGEKHSLVESDEYFDFINKQEILCKKRISIDIYDLNNYLLVKIKDEGVGFDTTILSSIFGVNRSYHCRGIFMSRSATLGIYYNNIANQIIFIVKLTD